MLPSPLVPGRSLPAVAGCKRYPSVFCILQFGRGVREAHHVGLCESRRWECSVVVEVVAAAAARESSHYTPLAFMTWHLGLLWRLSRHRCILGSSNAPNTRANHLPTLPCPRAFPDEVIFPDNLMFFPVGNIFSSSCKPARQSVVQEGSTYTLCGQSARGL